MNIAIVGYGRMGRMVMEEARRMGIGVSCVIDPFSDDKEVTGRRILCLIRHCRCHRDDGLV